MTNGVHRYPPIKFKRLQIHQSEDKGDPLCCSLPLWLHREIYAHKHVKMRFLPTSMHQRKHEGLLDGTLLVAAVQNIYTHDRRLKAEHLSPMYAFYNVPLNSNAKAKSTLCMNVLIP